MKRIITIATALTLIAGAASANLNGRNERPDPLPTGQFVVATTKVTAGSIYSTKELSRHGLEASDVVTVTEIPSSGAVDHPSKDG